MRRFGRILLLLAYTGVLQTALAATDAEASRACFASAAASSSDDKVDCSRSVVTDNNPRPQFRSLASHDSPPKLKDLGGSAAGILRPPVRDEGCQLGIAESLTAATPVYLITRRLRI